MEIRIQDQCTVLILSFVLGALLGFVYDLVRPLRYTKSGALSVITDVLYCLFAGWLVFLFAMWADGGRLGTWEPCFAALGFAAYLYTLSDPVLRVYARLRERMGGAIATVKKFLQNSADASKSVLKKR